MSAASNHTIVPGSDTVASAAFLGTILGVTPGAPWGDEDEFDDVFTRVEASGAVPE